MHRPPQQASYEAKGSLSPEDLPWYHIKPAEKFTRVPCYDDLRCARLQVPMDWNGASGGLQVEIAVLRIPAKVDVIDPRHGSAFIIKRAYRASVQWKKLI